MRGKWRSVSLVSAGFVAGVAVTLLLAGPAGFTLEYSSDGGDEGGAGGRDVRPHSDMRSRRPHHITSAPPSAERPLSSSLTSKIRFPSGPEVFPSSWRAAPINGTLKSLPPDRRARAVRLMNRAFQKYPKGLLTRALGAVHVMAELSFYNGIKYGGTFSGRDVYVVVGAPARGYTDTYVEATFHKEFSSVLLYLYPNRFSLARWREVNAPGFRYLGRCALEGNVGKDGGATAIERGEASPHNAYASSFLTSGLLSQYAASTIENDFNDYAGKLFMGDPWFWEMCGRYGAVSRKKDLIISFYGGIEPSFSDAYFKSLSP